MAHEHPLLGNVRNKILGRSVGLKLLLVCALVLLMAIPVLLISTIGFSFAFLIAAGATVVLTSFYAGVVFGKSYRLKAGAVFMTTYGLLYVLMRMQDFALMVGALASFLAIAATMYLTRNTDWYGQTNAVKMDKPEAE